MFTNIPSTISSVYTSAAQFGAVGNGVADDTAAIQTAINSINAGTIYLPSGTFVISSELQLGDNKFLVGNGRNATILIPSVNSINIIHHYGSNGGVKDLCINGNGMTGISALRITPLSESQTVTVTNQNYNVYNDLYIISCAEGIVLQAGPVVSTVGSGCWYNTFEAIHVQSTTRGVWLKDGPNASSSGCNRNKFIAMRIGQASMNTGVQIDSGVENEFYGVDFEGIAAFASPNATPTAVLIAASGAFSGGNNSNRFFGSRAESCTRALDNSNTLTELYGCNLSPALYTQTPVVMIGGSAASVMPYVHPAFTWQSNSQLAGIPNATAYLRGPLQFATTTDGINGVTDASVAGAGKVGEYLEALASNVSLVGSNTFLNLTSLTLTAGDWDVTGIVGFAPNGATATGADMGISTSATPATFADKVFGTNWLEGSFSNTAYGPSVTIGAYRVNVSTSTTYYLKASATFTAGTPKGYGRLSARRIR